MKEIEVGKIEQLTETKIEQLSEIDLPLDLPEEKDCETCKANFEKTHIQIKHHNEIQMKTNEEYQKKVERLVAENKLLEIEAKKHLKELKKLDKEFSKYKTKLRKKMLEDYPYGVYCFEGVRSVLDDLE